MRFGRTKGSIDVGTDDLAGVFEGGIQLLPQQADLLGGQPVLLGKFPAKLVIGQGIPSLPAPKQEDKKHDEIQEHRGPGQDRSRIHNRTGRPGCPNAR